MSFDRAGASLAQLLLGNSLKVAAMALGSEGVAVPKVKYQGIDKSSAGYKLLAAMGWSEGQGLVRCKCNFVSPVRCYDT